MREQTASSNMRVAVVTGASRGIGLEIARQLARRGIHVVLTSRDESKGQLAVQELAEEGLSLGYHQLDVTDPDGIRRLRDFLKREHDRVDILVNNAGIAIDDGTSAMQTPLDTVRRTMETNLYGPLLLSQTLVPLMRRKRHGRIVNVSSAMGQLSSMRNGAPSYRLSKAALNALARILAAELRRANILVNSMCPGHVRTAMGGSSAPRSVEEGADTAVWLALLPDDGPTDSFFRDRKPIPW
jgi:NAD(P)-dependent dehydrogenase (short-subunit alcohol dehydrogenase family)